jgi:Na+-translocating ferredoxin:NAD+ oxidoreductase RnfD subunit
MKLIFCVAIGIVFAFFFLVAPLPTMILGAVFFVAWLLIAGVAALIGAIVEEPARHRAEKAKRAALMEKRRTHEQLARAIGAVEPPPRNYTWFVLAGLALCALVLAIW